MRTFQTISFHINYFTKYGQNLFLAGSQWNNWKEFVPMKWSEGGRWELAWDAPIKSSVKPSVIEYKYIVCDQSCKDVTWESSGNRKLVVASDRANPDTKLTLIVNDVWDFPSQTSFAWKNSSASSTYFPCTAPYQNQSQNQAEQHQQQQQQQQNKQQLATASSAAAAAAAMSRNVNRMAVDSETRKREYSSGSDSDSDCDCRTEKDRDRDRPAPPAVRYENPVIDEERIRRINEQKRKKMIIARNNKAKRRPPTVPTPSPLSHCTTFLV